MPTFFSDPEQVADDIIRDVGRKLVVGLPLGLGKANHIINALYARASADRSIDLTFFSALTLEKPKPSNLLERRFITPVIDRLFGIIPTSLMPTRCGGATCRRTSASSSSSSSPDAGCTWRRRSRTTSPRTIPMPRRICSPPASTS
jgi:hypothetical protein